MHRTARRRGNSGFTLIELLIVVAIIGIVAAIALPRLWAAKRAANESSAIGTLRTINSGQSVYAASCGNGRYASTTAQLVNGQFASPDVLLPQKSGFSFALTQGVGAASAPDCVGGNTFTAYYASAQPIAALYAIRAFATNVAGTIWQDTTGVPPAEPFTPSGAVVPIGDR